MNQIQKRQAIQAIQQEVGWLYSDLPWFSEMEAQPANQERKQILNSLSDWVRSSFQGSKLHAGPLSPGCQICGNGAFGCNYITNLCTRSCFYCPQDHSTGRERPPRTDVFTFSSPGDHIHYLRTYQIRGVGFSGGEPLLVLDKVLAHMAAIRQEFGDLVHIWMYTNGDLADSTALESLSKAGLDEIRFDLSARNYDLAPLAVAKRHIPTLTVEIPAIPEHLELLRDLLGAMEAIGVDLLNLHQIEVSRHNYKALRQRKYHFLHQPSMAVFESEICALQLLEFAHRHQVRLPINYCSRSYKIRANLLDRMRLTRPVLEGYQEFTAGGYIRTFQVADSTGTIESLLRRFEENRCRPELWCCNEQRTQVILHSDLLSYVDWSSAEVGIRYHLPRVRLGDKAQGPVPGNLLAAHRRVYERSGWSRAAIECWRKLYIEGGDAEELIRSFYRDCPIEGQTTLERVAEEARALLRLFEWESLELGLQKVF